MLFCLSSGASARYLEDVIRALAMPQGTHLQFRYAKSWLDDSTIAKIETRTICGEKAIISYIDQSKPGVTPRIVPCRLAVVRDVHILGHSFCIVLEVTKFAFAKNIESFQQEIRKVDGGNLPHWVEEAGEPKLYGKWFLELSDHFCEFAETDNLKEWENIVKELAKSKDFEDKNQDLFFHVVGIGRIDQPGNRVALHDGYYPICSNTEYQMLIYQFQPRRVPENKWLKLTTSEKRIEFSSNPLVIIDSRYDLKSIHFNSAGSAWKKRAVITIQEILGDPDSKDGKSAFDIPLELKSSHWRNAAQVAIIGATVSAPAIIGIYVADKGSVGAGAIMFLVGCTAGIASLFDFRRGV